MIDRELSPIVMIVAIVVIFAVVRVSERGAQPNATDRQKALRRWLVPIAMGAIVALLRAA